MRYDLKAKRLFKKTFAIILVLMIFLDNILIGNLFYRGGLKSVEAASYTISKSVEFDRGYFDKTEASFKEGELKLMPAGSWGPRVFKTPDVPLGDQSAIASDGQNIYLLASNDNYFAQYRPSENRWRRLANAPKWSYPGAQLVYLNGYLYAVFGGYQKEFYRYSLARNTWERRSDLPDLVYDGASCATDGSLIYCLRGTGTVDFWSYNPSTDTWTIKTATLGPISYGAGLVYYNGNLYALRGYNSTTMYRYNIAANTWYTTTTAGSPLAAAPASMYDDHTITIRNNEIFVTRDYNTNTFYKYNIDTNSWTTLPTAPQLTRYVGVVYNSSEDMIYVFRGNYTYDFWKYNPVTNNFLGPADLPNTPGTGADLVYHNGYLYHPRGNNTTNFYRYNITTNSWETRANTPGAFYDDTKGVATATYLYFLRGGGYRDLYRYDPVANSWTTMTNLTPATVGSGASLVYPGSGIYLYATRGSLTRTFWRYDILTDTWDDAAVADLPDDAEAGYGSRLITDGTDIYYIGGSGISSLLKYTIATNSWSVLNSVPFSPFWGTDCAYRAGKIYCQAGYYKKEFWEYDITGNSWRRLVDLQSNYAFDIGPYNGGSLEYDSVNDVFYSISGQNIIWMLSYTPSSSNYQASGAWISEALDLDYVLSWGNLVANVSTPSDSTITFETRSSSDQDNWSGWSVVSSGVINSPVNRYLQIRATLNASSDNSQTPVISSITVNYVGDENPPTNPTSFSGKSQQVNGVNLTSGSSYRYSNPYFSWSGATDSETGVAGYYVYFGTNPTADPQTMGSFQTTSDYLVTFPMSQTTYYLRLKTKDNAGNVSSAVEGFVYQYIGVAPPTTITQTTTSDFNQGTSDKVNVNNDEIKLLGRTGFWQQERLSYTPASIYAGGKLAYVASTKKLYTFRGYNTNTFYEYDIETDIWTTKATAPSAVYWGGGVVEGPSGYLYGWPGNNSNKFWRYDIAQNLWSDTDASDAPLSFYYGTDMIFDGDRYLYVIRGNYDDAFLRYDTETDTWENLANINFGAPENQVNNLAYSGANLAYDGLDTIYAIQGNRVSGFTSYSISNNSWTPLLNTPALTNYGGNIEYDSQTNALYYFPGWDRPQFYKYDLATQSWSEMAEVPTGLGNGASMRKVDRYFYVLRGQGTTSFYKYNIDKNSWLLPNIGLFGGFFRGGDYRSFNYGADIVKGDGDNFYLTRGNYDNLFIRYNASTGEVTQLANAPAGFYIGGDLVYDSVNNKIYATASLYYRKFYVYDIDGDIWSEISSDPPPFDPNSGSVMIFDGSRYIYWLRGGGTEIFYRYDTQGTAGSRWTALPNAPAGLSYGADMVLKENYLYVLRGGNTTSFYRYGPLSGSASWDDAAATDLPTGKNIYNDGFLVDGGDYLYACRGANTSECFRYSLTNNSWEAIANAPANIYYGGAAAVYNNEKILVIAGQGFNTWSDGLYSYIIESNNSSFESSGTYTSPVFDLGQVYKFANLSLTYTERENTSLLVETRSSSDQSQWSLWSEASELKAVGATYQYKINSPPARYLQVRFTLTSADNIYSGTISDYTINYYKDETPPTNPTSLTAYSSATKSATLTTDNWYNYSSPYFEWPQAETTGGATDGANGSGVAGYYVYFGTDASAIASQSGTLITNNSYTASGISSGETYYLRIQTVDDAGNIFSDIWQPFIYKFDNEPPTNPTTITVNPPGYTNVNNYTFNWIGATDSASLIKEYCYKTGESGANETCTQEASASGSFGYQTGVNTFYLRAKDYAGNFASSYAAATYYYSSVAPGAVQNLRVTYPENSSSNTINEFAFAWDPPELYYGQQSGLRYYYSVNALPTANNVIGPLSVNYVPRDAYATQKGVNRFYVVTKDEAGNIDYNVYSSVEFTADTQAPGIPRNLDISDVSIKETKSWRLALSWDIPEATGSGVANYKIYRYDSNATGSATLNITCQNNFSDFNFIASTTQTSYVDTNLTQTKKYYCVRACDSTNECSAVSDTVNMYPDGRWRTAPILVASPSATVKTKTALITWSTNRTASSFVKYGKSSGNYGDETGNSDQVAYHQVNLIGLEPGTTYYYKALWTDEDGNTGYSDELTFTTNPAPYVSNVKFTNININSVFVTFTIKNAIKSTLEYGTTVNYGSTQSISTSTSESTYTVELTNLLEGTLYHLRIAGEDEEGNTYYSDDYTFETLPIPKITDLKIQQVIGLPTATLRLLWQTNALTSSVVTYYPTSLPQASKDYINLVLKNKHDVLIKDLSDNTEYTLIIKGKDSIGNEVEPKIQKLKTVADIRPPEILNLETESTVIGVGDDAKAQIVVSWDTDEPATTQVEYNIGTGTTYGQSTTEDSSLTTNHQVSITGLRPGQIYHLRAVSKDKAGNVGYSYDTVIVTPKATKDALTIVVENLSKTFGFLKKVIK